MAYVVPIHRPSSIRHALKLRFFAEDEECLAVAKGNRLELWRQSNNGLVLEQSSVIYGKITVLQRLPPPTAAFAPASQGGRSNTDHLFVGTDRYTFFSVSWDREKRRLRTETSFVDVTENGARDAQMGEKGLVDPSGRVVVLQLYEGILTVVPILKAPRKGPGAKSGGNLGAPVPSRIPELFVRSMAFLHNSDPPRLALLWEDGQRRAHVRVKKLEHHLGSDPDPGSVELTDTECLLSNLRDQGASHLIPIQDETGFLILGETSITRVNGPGTIVDTLQLEDPTVFVAWERLAPNRYLISDDFGGVYLLQHGEASLESEAMEVESVNPQESKLRCSKLGTASRASTLVSLGEDIAFVGSHQGDSKVLSLDLSDFSIEVVQTLPNVAPILDFTIMDMGNRGEESQTNEYSSGQARIVTGSGAFEDGSLRSVRSGVGVEELGILGDIGGIRDMFSLRPGSAETYVDTLVTTLVGETRVFNFGSEGEVEEVDSYRGLDLSESTLVASNLPSDQVLQVTSSSVRVIDDESDTVLSEWQCQPGQTITDAAANNERVLLSIDGIKALALDIQGGLSVLAQKPFDSQNQIACLTLPGPSSSICVLGFWHSSALSIYNVDTLEQVLTEKVGESDGISLPRTLLMAQVLADQPPTLFVGMADGVVHTYVVDPKQSTLSGKRSMVLGTQQPTFRPLLRPDGLSNVFTICEHPSLIYGSEGKLVYSAVTTEAATCVCPFDSELYPNSIMVATADDLRIAVIDAERATHVRSLPVNETVRRVAHSSKLRAFGLGTIARSIEDGEEVVRSHIKLVDEVMFGLLDTYDLNKDELVESVIRADLDHGAGVRSEKFIVGTGYLDDDHDESIRGRILVFEVTEDRRIRLVTEEEVKGACRCLSIMNDYIVAALIKTVLVYTMFRSGSRPFLSRVASYRTATAPIDLAIAGNTIAVADLMKSVSIVELEKGEAGAADKLVEVARHFQTVWSTALAHVDEDTYLESDAEGNLMVLHRNRNGVTKDDLRRLEVTSEMRLGEMVNRIRRINVPTSSDATVIPRAFLATVEGSIYLFALIHPTKQDLLMRLQATMTEHIRSPGNMTFNIYRAFKNTVRAAEEPFRFVDGELIERFLTCDNTVQEEIIGSLNRGAGTEDPSKSLDVDHLTTLIESLKRLH